MNWTHVIQAGYIGAGFAIVFALMRKKNWIGRGSAVVLTLAAIAAWNIVDYYYLKKSSDQIYQQKIDAALQSMPGYKVIEEYDPQTYSQIRSRMIMMRKEGKNEQQFIDAIQPQILAIQRKLLQLAPDAQVVAVMQGNIEKISTVQKISDDACYKFLFPEVKGRVNIVSFLPRDRLIVMMNIDAAMMRSAYGPHKHIITDEEKQNAFKDIQSVARQLIPKYGQDFGIMDDPYKGLGKEKIACELVLDVWNRVLLLPDVRAAGVIRMVLSEGN